MDTIWLLSKVIDLLNSPFIQSLTGALAGAGAGALSAQRLVERAKRRDDYIEQIQSVNAAVMLAFGICNTALAMKGQLVKPMCEAYKAAREEVQEFGRKRATGEIPPDQALVFRADLQTLQLPLFPIKRLQNQVYERTGISGRPLAVVTSLAGAIASLSVSIEHRAKLIEQFKAMGDAPPHLYFGLPSGGHVNAEFKDTIAALESLTDDIVYFSRILADDLHEHGACLLKEYKAAGSKSEISIHSADFSKAVAAGLMPRDEHYADWNKGFKRAA